MNVLTRANSLTAVVIAVVVACASIGLYEGALASLVLLTTFLSVRVLSGKRELRRWPTTRSPRLTDATPLSYAAEEVLEASRGNLYFRERLASVLLSAYLLKDRGIAKPSQLDLAEAQEELVAKHGSSDVRAIIDPRRIRSGGGPRGRDYLGQLQRVVDTIRNG